MDTSKGEQTKCERKMKIKTEKTSGVTSGNKKRKATVTDVNDIEPIKKKKVRFSDTSNGSITALSSLPKKKKKTESSPLEEIKKKKKKLNGSTKTDAPLDFDQLSSSLKSRADEKITQVQAKKQLIKSKESRRELLDNVKQIKKQLKTKQKQMEVRQLRKKKKHINIVQDKDSTTFRERLKERQKLRRGPLYDMAERSKKIWELLRKEDTTTETKQKLCAELMKLIEGNVKFLSMAHDTTRVLECLVQFGNEQQKSYIFEQIKNDIPLMSKSLYAHHLIIKLLTYGTVEQKQHIVKSFYRHVCKLARHTIGCRVLEHCYNDVCSAFERFQLVQEFYGREYCIVKATDEKNIEQLFEKKNEIQRASILEHLKEYITPCVEKDLLNGSIIHRVLHEYMRFANESGRTEMIDNVKERLIKMIHSRDGGRVAMYCVWYGTVKDRKLLIKSLKTFVVKIAKEEHGYPFLLAIFDCVDDTKLVSKIILQELMSNFDELIDDPHGKKVLMYLVSPRNTRHFNYDLIKLLKTADTLTTSKKDAVIRQQELFDYCKKFYLNYYPKNMFTCLKDGYKGLMMAETLEKVNDDMTLFYKSLSETLQNSSMEANNEQNLIEHHVAHNVLRQLITADEKRTRNTGNTSLISSILDNVSSDTLHSWVLCNRGCFIFVMMLEHGVKNETEHLRELLQPTLDTIKRQSFAGAKVLMEKLTTTTKNSIVTEKNQ